MTRDLRMFVRNILIPFAARQLIIMREKDSGQSTDSSVRLVVNFDESMADGQSEPWEVELESISGTPWIRVKGQDEESVVSMIPKAVMALILEL